MWHVGCCDRTRPVARTKYCVFGQLMCRTQLSRHEHEMGSDRLQHIEIYIKNRIIVVRREAPPAMTDPAE